MTASDRGPPPAPVSRIRRQGAASATSGQPTCSLPTPRFAGGRSDSNDGLRMAGSISQLGPLSRARTSLTCGPSRSAADQNGCLALSKHLRRTLPRSICFTPRCPMRGHHDQIARLVPPGAHDRLRRLAVPDVRRCSAKPRPCRAVGDEGAARHFGAVAVSYASTAQRLRVLSRGPASERDLYRGHCDWAFKLAQAPGPAPGLCSASRTRRWQ